LVEAVPFSSAATVGRRTPTDEVVQGGNSEVVFSRRVEVGLVADGSTAAEGLVLKFGREYEHLCISGGLLVVN
jgi:hypothetical protein